MSATNKASREQVLARQERRRSNAAGTHRDRRDRRVRTRANAKARAMREYA
jgi:hypothetical protein